MTEIIKSIYPKLKEKDIDALFLNHPANISYLTNYRSRDSYLLISRKGIFYLTDSRYTNEASEFLANFKIIEISGSLSQTLANLCNRLSIRQLGFEERRLSFSQYNRLNKRLSSKIKLVATDNIVEYLRQIKSPAEITKIKKSADIIIKAFKFAKSLLKPGVKEIEIAAELERFIRYQGAYTSSFDIIIASGANSSYPHHVTSQRKLKLDEPVLIDMGVDYSGYKSDLTRVFFLGKINTLTRSIYEIVLRAQQEALDIIKPGVRFCDVDRASRQYIAQKGYGGLFGHHLGHGIGLEVHEFPAISPKDEGRLKQGMVFTIEPAIYLPHKIGIRIEDMVLVTKKGAELISGCLDK
jgi:Xaa-Pro aminopeptidase